jgi:hypothetical protein
MNSHTNLIAAHTEHCYPNVIADFQGLPDPSRQYQHPASSLLAFRAMRPRGVECTSSLQAKFA